MVRIANLRDIVEAGTQTKTADRMSASEVLTAARARVVEQRERAGSTFETRAAPGAGRARDPDPDAGAGVA